MFLNSRVFKMFLSLSVGFRDSVLFSAPYLISLTDAILIPQYLKPGSREPVYFLLGTSRLSKGVQPSHPHFISFNYPLSEEVSCKLDMECVLPFMYRPNKATEDQDSALFFLGNLGWIIALFDGTNEWKRSLPLIYPCKPETCGCREWTNPFNLISSDFYWQEKNNS